MWNFIFIWFYFLNIGWTFKLFAWVLFWELHISKAVVGCHTLHYLFRHPKQMSFLVVSGILPDRGLNPQPRHVSWVETEPVTFCFAWWLPTNWATLVRATESICFTSGILLGKKRGSISEGRPFVSHIVVPYKVVVCHSTNWCQTFPFPRTWMKCMLWTHCRYSISSW